MKTRYVKIAALVLVLVIAVFALLTGVQHRKPEQMVEAKMVENMIVAEPSPEPPKESAAYAPNTVAVEVQKQLASRVFTYVDGERKLIRKASLNFSVKNVYVSALAIEDAVGSFGGFVTQNDIKAQEQDARSYPLAGDKRLEFSTIATQGNLVVRVPSAKAQDFLRALAAQVEFLSGRKYSAQDVQFDLLRKQLAMRRNADAQDALALASRGGGKLKDQTEAIEAQRSAAEGRDEAIAERKELDDQVAFATIEIAIAQPTQVRKVERDDVEAIMRRNEPGFGRRAITAISAGSASLGDFSLAFLAAWPNLMVLGAAVVLLRRWLQRRR